MLFDEADQLFANGDGALVGILNSGHRRPAAYRVVTEKVDDVFVPRRFPTFAAMCFAGIGVLPPTLQDRSIVVWLTKARRGEVPDHLENGTSPDLEVCSRKLARWARDFIAKYDGGPLPRPETGGVENRDADNFRPLIMIAEEAGGDWPSLAVGCMREAMARKGAEDPSELIRLLSDIRRLFDPGAHSSCDRMPASTLLAALNNDEEAPWADMNGGNGLSSGGLARRLRGVITLGDPRANKLTKNMKTEDGGTTRFYAREQFEEAWSRFLPTEHVLSQPGGGTVPPVPPGILIPEKGGTGQAIDKNEEFWPVPPVPPVPPNMEPPREHIPERLDPNGTLPDLLT
ncbi:MAG: DUF3631 domain-containing protein [Proteobacteria bacterium]|nr:DUF3631 domain-containing protein [Pseudomonadota bacterium]